MRMPWHKSKDAQLDLLDFAAEQNTPHRPVEACARSEAVPSDPVELPPNASKGGVADGRPMLVAVSLLYEDANNPRTEFPEAAHAELAMDIQQRAELAGNRRRQRIAASGQAVRSHHVPSGRTSRQQGPGRRAVARRLSHWPDRRRARCRLGD